MQGALQGGFKRLNQIMRQILQKSNRIDQQKLYVVNDKFPRRRVQGGKKLVFDVHVGVGQQIQ